MEAMGVLQHHDAVTGTSRTHVAWDYQRRLSEAIASSDELYTSLMNEYQSKQLGLDSNSTQWERCTLENSTYHDCPINKTVDSDAFIMVAIHNPGEARHHFITLKVPHANIGVEAWDHMAAKWVEADAHAICEMVRLEDKDRTLV